MKKILIWFKRKIYFRQHPDTALRYIPIIKLLKNHDWLNKKILEIGSGSYGITPYLNKKVDGLDIEFSEPEYELLNRIPGSALDIPFKDSSYDLILLSDVLEHIPGDKRAECLKEAIRVAKIGVIISGPFGKEAFNQDKVLSYYSLKTTGKMHQFFAEHLKYGLPEVQSIFEITSKIKKVENSNVVGLYLNLSVRNILMKLFISQNKLLYYLYLKGLMPLVPILSHLNSKPCYRTLILIKLK